MHCLTFPWKQQLKWNNYVLFVFYFMTCLIKWKLQKIKCPTMLRFIDPQDTENQCADTFQEWYIIEKNNFRGKNTFKAEYLKFIYQKIMLINFAYINIFFEVWWQILRHVAIFYTINIFIIYCIWYHFSSILILLFYRSLFA